MAFFESFDGTRLAFEVEGEGVPVLLLHGFASDGFLNWVRPGVVDALVRAGFRAIVLDQRGHGASDKPHEEEAYAGDAMVRDAQTLLDHLGLERCLGAGYSMGARNLLSLLARDDRVRAAVLGGVGGNMLRARTFGSAVAEAMEAPDKSEVSDPLARSFRDFADLTRADRTALAAIMRQARPPLEGIEHVAVPVLVLVGEDDPLASSPEELVRALPRARLVRVAGTHLNVVNNPAFHEALLAFLNEHKSEAT